MKEYINRYNQNLLKSICDEFPMLPYSAINKLLRKKDIKVNGKRVAENVLLNQNDVVQVYYNFEKDFVDFEIVYQDDNIIIVNKPQGIEVVGSSFDLTHLITNKLKKEVLPCHRLDQNTQGLVVFAFTKEFLDIVEGIFKSGQIEKSYLALVYGHPSPKKATKTAYLFKDNKKAQVYIYDTNKPKTKRIITKYNVKQEYSQTSLVEVKIPTGRTHQIRAHMSYLGYPIVGDQKYGQQDINKRFETKKQMLCAYKLKFNVDEENKLFYLNNKEFEIKPKFIEKLKNIK